MHESEGSRAPLAEEVRAGCQRLGASPWAPWSTARRPLIESDLLIVTVRKWIFRGELTYPRSQLMTDEPRSPESHIFPFFDTHQPAFEIFSKLSSWESSLLFASYHSACSFLTLLISPFYFYFISFILFCWPCRVACRISVSQPGIEPGPW